MIGCCGTPSWNAEGSAGRRLDSGRGTRRRRRPPLAPPPPLRGAIHQPAMGEDLVTTLSMENGAGAGHHHGPCTFLSMDPSGHLDGRAVGVMVQPRIGAGARAHTHAVSLSGAPPPDINQPWLTEACDMLDVGLGPQVYDAEAVLSTAPKAGSRKTAKRGDSIWGAWFFFTFYFKPLLSDKGKSKVVRDANGVSSGFDKSDLRLDMFLVQHDMENMYMWVFKERPDNALGKMQLRSYMNGHSRPGEPHFPFSVDRGFVRSHRMQRKHYRGLSNPQCIHGIEVVNSPNLVGITDVDRRRWAELTGRELNFCIPQEASDFGTWRTMPNAELELERPQPTVKSSVQQPPKKLLNGSGLNLSSPSNHSEDGMDLSPVSSKRRKEEAFPHAMDEECFLPLNTCAGRTQQDIEMHSAVQPSWLHDFTGVMTKSCGPATAAKSIYEDDHGYLIMVSLPFVDQQRVKVSWKNTLTHGVVKILCVSTARTQYIRRHDRVFKLTDATPEHCPPGEFLREIHLATRIPEDAKLEACFDEAAAVLEIMVPKRGNEPEEHEVRVSMRPPHLGVNDLLMT